MRQFGLSARTIAGVSRVQSIEIAATLGLPWIGLAFDDSPLDSGEKAAIRQRLSDSGVRAIDAEVVRLGHTPIEQAGRMMADAAELGVPHFIVTCYLADPVERRDMLGRIADMGRDLGIRPMLEFARFSTIPDLAAALRAVADADSRLGLLVDPLHLDRSGGEARDLATVPPGLMPYVQFCDAPARPGDGSAAGLLHEARTGRLPIGEGALPLAPFVAALPDETPLMLEILSSAITARFADPVERARHLAETARHWLSAHEEREA